MVHMSAQQRKGRLLTLHLEARGSVVEKRATAHLSRVEKSLQGYNKNQGVASPGHLPPTARMETLAKVFLVNLPASVEKRAFSASGRIVSPDPQFSSEANQHPLIERSSANRVQVNSQVISARAHTVLASKGPIERRSRRRHSFIKRFNH